VPEGLAVFPLQLSSFIQDQKITVWYSVPMELAFLQARGRLEERDLAALRCVLLAGEVSDQGPADADGKATTPSLCQLLRTDETNVCA
jgi:acyl-coenzyme A synthetase/AMP-(fatty) acid ligase